MWVLLTTILISTAPMYVIISTSPVNEKGNKKTTATSAMDYIELANRNLKDSMRNKENEVIYDTDIVFSYAKRNRVKSGKTQNAAIKMVSRLWPGAVIPFVFARNIERLPEAKNIVKDAMTEWETNTCIRFVERTNEKDYVEFAINLGCNADVGKRGGKQVVSLGNGCLHKSVVIHEIGHVIGFWHEQNRPDRDQYVHIYTENILDLYKEAFAKFSKYRIDPMNVTYDYHSIMHYGMKAFSKNGELTIKPKKKGIFSLGNDRLSPLDIKQTNLLYKCDKINRGWTKWSRWIACDKTCAGGTQERTRVCTSLKDGKQQCPGSKVEKRVCNQQKCPDWPTFPTDFSFEHLRVDQDQESECVLIYERADYQEWNSYSFCNRGKRAIQMRWSDQGPIAGMKCTQIFEPKEKEKNRWYDNYLCLPTSAPYNFSWSVNGRKKGKACINWYAKAGRDGWDNNFLCAEGNSNTVNWVDHAPVNGGWSHWSLWSRCNKDCGNGRQRRVRFCNNPRVQHGGRSCQGRSHEDRQCNQKPCRASQCGGELKETKGEFMSPNYPSNYPKDLNCTWVIKGAKDKHIRLTITSFDLEKLFDGPCKFDYLQVKDRNFHGKELGKFCGSSIPQPIVSISNTLWVSLVTDGEDSKAGFRASWKLEEAQPEGCGGMITGLKGKFTTPNFPSAYPPQKTCIWKIEVPEGFYIQMKFVSFNVEKHAICKYDSVEVKDGWNRTSPLLGRYCGMNPVRGTLKTRTNRGWVKFVSDHSTQKRGFKLSWRAYKKEENNEIPRDDETTDRTCPDGWLYFANTIEGGACYRVKRNYFNWYGARDDCLHNTADLVSITTKTEQDFVTQDLLQGNYMWLGMNDVNSEGRWAWSDNTTRFSFYNWDHGDPNDGGQLHNEDCVLIKPDGKWNDYPCEDRFNYICKRKPLEPWNLGPVNKPPRRSFR